MTTEDPDPIVRAARVRVGQVLAGKYRLERVLGIGGFAAVYAASHRNKSRVAVKILHRQLSVDRDLRERFRREGYIANTIDHPGVVKVLDDDVAEDGSVFLVMELLEGETLDARWERFGRQLKVGEVVGMMIDFLDVLAAAHAKGVIFRDGKPENLFLTRDGRLKVLDMGIARLHGESSPTRTKSGAIFGTPAFMSPEQALGRVREVDHLSDVWAVGATAFTLLSGRFVHEGETAEEMVVRAATTPVPPLANVMRSVPESVAGVIDRALCFDRNGRWPSALAMKEALVAAQGESILLFADDFGDGDRTKVAPAPKMTRRPEFTSAPPDSTLPLPTLPAVSTVAGIASDSRPRRGRGLLHVVVAAFVAAFRELFRRASSSIAVVTASSTVRHRRKLIGAAASGIIAAGAIGTVIVLVARAGGSKAPGASAAASALPPPIAVATGSEQVSPAAAPVAPSAVPDPTRSAALAVSTSDLPSATPSPPPLVAATNFPGATSAATAVPATPTMSAPTKHPASAAVPATPTSRPSCVPPYTIDAKGKKTFKMECL